MSSIQAIILNIIRETVLEGRSNRGGRENRNKTLCQICTKFGHIADRCYFRYTPKNHNSGYSANSSNFSYTNAFYNPQMSAMVASYDLNIDSNWYPNSGATNHLTQNLSNLSTGSEYGGGHPIYAANGSVSEPHNTYAADRESGNFGCLHYRRRCKIRAPCCDEVFDCRHCHNEAKNSLELETLDPHDVPRHQIQKVICSLCDTEQDVQQYCSNCGVCFGKYFCSICKFFDDDVSKSQYHCDECGICRTGGKENFFHCKTCGCCYSKLMKDGHRCIERAMHHSCPVCFEFLFDTTKDISVLPCGHTIHLECAKEMESHFQYSCPVCSKSICDMSRLWVKLDKVIASTPMPDIYKNKKVWILCNDCGAEGEVQFHVVAHKCLDCNSYNTKQTIGRRPTASCSSTTVPEIVS